MNESLKEYSDKLVELLESMTQCINTCKNKTALTQCDPEFKDTINILIESFVCIDTLFKDRHVEKYKEQIENRSEQFASNFEDIIMNVNSGRADIDIFMPSNFTTNFNSWKSAILEIEVPKENAIKKHKINLKSLRGQ